MSFCHGSAAANDSKIVSVSCQIDPARDLNNTEPKSHATVITIEHVLLDSSIEKFSSDKRNCVLDQVQPWRKLDLQPTKACPDTPASPTHDFWSGKANSPSSPAQDSVLRKACPDFPSSPTRDSLSTTAYRDSQRRLSRVIEESESFAKREGVSVVPPPRADLFYCSTPNSSSTASSSSTSSRDSVDEKPLFKHEKAASPVIKEKAKKATKRTSLCSIILYPLKKIRDAYVTCMMSIDGAGDFAGMVQGGHIVSTGAFFAEPALSKTDCRNYG